MNSIELPVIGKETITYKTGEQTPGQFKHIEIEILTACDLACFGCDRMSDITSAPNMSYAQVKHFVDESLELNWEWERIRFLGGEPTLHPQFELLVCELLRYRDKFPNCFLQILTNGLGKAAKYRQWLESQVISLHAESKTKGETPAWFNNTRIVPLDRESSIGELEPCGIFGVHGCGIGLTTHGYFLDGAGATVARVAGYDIGVMELKNVTWETMLQQAKVLCRVCGHWNPPEGGIVTKKVSETGEITGPFWTEKLAAFKKQRPQLKVYGEK